MRFEWDGRKAAANVRKHGVAFEEATGVFYYPDALDEYDALHSDSEERFNLVGLSSRRLLYGVYAERPGDVVRIISARRANNVERKRYERARDGRAT